MNERIRELVKQATLATYYNAVTGVTSETFDKEKFAELIVRECVRYFNEDYERDFDTLWREDLSRGIKQHFGVEE